MNIDKASTTLVIVCAALSVTSPGTAVAALSIDSGTPGDEKKLIVSPSETAVTGVSPIVINDLDVADDAVADYHAHIIGSIGEDADEDSEDGDLIPVQWIPGVGLVDRS